jgi:hypothetical protein
LGDHPAGLFKEYETLKAQVMQILTKNNNKLFYVDKLSKAKIKHGQIWAYKDALNSYI